MLVIRNTGKVKVGDIDKGNTFRYTDEEDGIVGDFIAMNANSCFILSNVPSQSTVDTGQNVLVYNINAACFGVLKNEVMVIPTDSELSING